MIRLLGRRLGLAIPMLAAIAILTFMLSLSSRVDPVAVILGDSATPDAQQALRRKLGLDSPLIVQFGHWVWNGLHGDLGRSYITDRAVGDMIAQSLPITLEIAVGGIILALLIGIPLGVSSAIHGGTWRGKSVEASAVVLVAVPEFWIGLILVLIFGVFLGVLPVGGFTPLGSGVWPWLSSLILPWVAIALPVMGTMIRQTSNAVSHEMASGYVRAMRLRGIRERTNRRFALRNALVPVLANLGLQFTYAVSGSLVVELAFALPGMGKVLGDAVSRGDLPVLQAGVLVITVVVILVNVVVDIAYVAIDPRVRVQ